MVLSTGGDARQDDEKRELKCHRPISSDNNCHRELARARAGVVDSEDVLFSN